MNDKALLSFVVRGEPDLLIARLFQARGDETLFGLTATARGAPSGLADWTRFRDYLMEGFVFYNLRVLSGATGITLEIRPTGGSRDKYLRSHLRWHLATAKVEFEEAG